MNKVILILMFLLIVPSIYAIDKCTSPIEPKDIPCRAVSTYLFDNGCNSELVKIFDSNPTLLDTRNWDDWGIGGRCNITFNYTTRGVYTLNSSDGSTATIVVEGYKMEYFRIIVFSLFFGLSMIFLSFMHKYKEDVGSSIVYGTIATLLLIVMGSMITFGFDVIITDIEFMFNINYYLAALCYAFSIYTGFYAWFIFSENSPKELGRYE